MTHVDNDAVQRVLHGELDPTAQDRTRAHLVACDECRARVADAQRDENEILQLLHQLDQPVRAVSVAQVRLPARGRSTSVRRIAALLALSAGALAAAYVAPGSPLRRGAPSSVPLAPADATPTAAGTPSEVGLAVDAGATLSLLFAAPQQRGTAIVSLVDGTALEVRTLEGAARFTVDNHRVLIDNRGSSADFHIRIGRSAPRVDVRIGGRLVLSKKGGQIESSVAVDRAGQYPVTLRSP